LANGLLLNPARRDRFTACLTGSPARRISCRRRVATSSSRVRVVRTSWCFRRRHH